MYFRENCKKTKINKVASVSATGNDNSKIISRTVRDKNMNTLDSEFIYIDLIYENKDQQRFQSINFDCSRNVPIINNVELYKMGVISINGSVILPLLTDLNQITVRMTWNQGTPADPIKIPREKIYILNIQAIYPNYIGKIYTVREFLVFINRAIDELWREVRTQFNTYAGDADAWQNDDDTPKNITYIKFNEATQLFEAYSDPIMAIDRLEVANDYQFVLSFDAKVSLLLDGLVGVAQVENFSIGVGSIVPTLGYGKRITDDNIPDMNAYDNVVLVGPLVPPEYAGGIDDPIPDSNNNQFYYVRNVQDFPSIGRWNNTTTLVIISNTLPTRKEIVAVSDNIATTSVNTQLNILQTFPISVDGRFNRITEFSKPNINYCDILGQGPLNRISFTIDLFKADGSLEHLLCPPNSTILVKLVFAKANFTSN